MLVLGNIFQPLIDVFEWVIVKIHDGVGGSWGLSIILLTILVRAAILPLTLRQFRSMQAMAKLQPEIKALQAKYKDDKQRLNQEMMKFYQENKVNPLGSCLPLVAQLPVFISLFYMLRTDLKQDICPGIQHYAQTVAHKGLGSVSCSSYADHTHQSFDTGFLFIPDLTARATGSVLIALIVLYVGTQLASSLLMSVTADRNQRMIMLALPFFFTIFILNFPAGLILYWITTNAWTILQQYIVRRTVGPIRPPQTADGQPQPSPFTMLREALSGAGGGGGDSGAGKGNGAAKGGSKEKVAAGAAPKPKPRGGPPPSARKKKKRSGRRR
jgi:YidC/Oxa1 family membrane protein insertase